MPGKNIHEFASGYYENFEYNLSNGETDDAVSDQTGWGTHFGEDKQLGYAKNLSIRTDKTVTVKLNKNTEDAITVAAGDSPFELTNIEVRDVFISNASGDTAAIKVLVY